MNAEYDYKSATRDPNMKRTSSVPLEYHYSTSISEVDP